MAWTKEQQDQIVEDFWSGNNPTCPNDDSVIKIKWHGTIGGGYFLLGSCPRCQSQLKRDKAEDPKIATFRPWTDIEKGGMVNDHFQGRGIECPVCQADVIAKHHPVIGGRGFVLLSCRRCGNSSQSPA